jgi:cytidyltransferase-like protein
LEKIIVSGSFDDLRSRQVRFLEEASRLGELRVLLWSDKAVRSLQGKAPKFPQDERFYLLQSLRYVHEVSLINCKGGPDELADLPGLRADVWVVDETDNTPRKAEFCRANGIGYRVLAETSLKGFPLLPEDTRPVPGRMKVIVTGCYDWLHSGHVRFFEEASALGDLYVCVGNDRNVRFLKGEGHPLFCEDERRYMVQAVRFVKRAMLTSGDGWMDAEPEIAMINPDLYVVNEDGDKPEKREFCQQHHLNYVILKRLPKEGLPRRESTWLRGF